MMRKTAWLSACYLLGICLCLNAAALPDGWRAYLTGAAAEKAKCSVTAVKGGIKIVDNSHGAEAGVSRNFPVITGKHYKFTVSHTPEPLRGMEVTAYYGGKIHKRAGKALISPTGKTTVSFGPVPQGAERVTIFFYSMKPAINTTTIYGMEGEVSDKPFPQQQITYTPPARMAIKPQIFYVAPDGNDANPGTEAKPWKTLAQASTVTAGTTVLFKPGRYEGNMDITHSGTPEAPIIFRSEKPGQAVFTGGKSREYTVVIRDCHYVQLDGFRFDVKPGTRWLLVQDAWYCTVQNCHMELATVPNPIRCRNVHYSKFDNLKVFRSQARGSDRQVSGDMWNNDFVTHTVFSRIYFSRNGHRPLGIARTSSNNVVRDCVFDCRWGRNFEFFSTKNILVERCIITNSYEGSGSFDGRAKLFTIDGIFRYNLMIRNNSCPLIINAYRYKDSPMQMMRRSCLYFNTWHYNQDAAWQMVDMKTPDGSFMVQGNMVKNNIMSANNPADGTALLLTRNIAPDNCFRNNLLRGNAPGDKTIKWNWMQVDTYTPEAAEKDKPAQFSGNFDADPGFENPEKDNYRLKAASAAVDRAEPLTVATEDSSGIYLSVKDTRYFYDGYGIPGESGDTLMIGPDKVTAKVILNLPEEKILVLDRRVTVKKGDAVNLPYAGKAPDLGCFERGMETGPTTDPSQYRIEKMDTAVKTVINCTFEENSLEDWFYFWNHTRKANSSAKHDLTTAATGKGSWKVYYRPNSYGKKDGGSQLSTHIVPANWMIDRFPYLRFSYRVPKGVPVGVSIHETSMIGRAKNPPVVFLGGSPALSTQSKYTKYINMNLIPLIDDDKWHTVTVDVRAIRKHFPNVKMLSLCRFWTPAVNGKPGDCYWIDNFAIMPEKK